MSEIAIDVVNIGKRYQIGALQKQYDRLGEQVADMLRGPIRRAAGLLRGQEYAAAELEETIWALRNICFKVENGEAVGIIGRNGAGKTTLLKVLSRITEPNEGYADIYGRVGSLLEVGTGFHPELTGRENIFLNGAVLGMSKEEIEQRFDTIVDFAEIGPFIDTPVKHYSSGMFVRLAFSIAAHMEPEILLIDEVLAVGDVAFQKKCLGKMGDVAEEGRTVLFVSHNMGLVQSLCDRGILIEKGKILADGPITEVVDQYLQLLESASSKDLSQREDRRGVGKTRIVELDILAGSNGVASPLRSGEPARFSVGVEGAVPDMDCSLAIYDHLGQPVAIFKSNFDSPHDVEIQGDEIGFTCEVEELLLLPGRYRLDVSVMGDGRLQDYVQTARLFDVVEGRIAGRLAHSDKRFRISMPHRWKRPPRR